MDSFWPLLHVVGITAIKYASDRVWLSTEIKQDYHSSYKNMDFIVTSDTFSEMVQASSSRDQQMIRD